MERKIIADYQSKVETLQEKVMGLEASVDEKEGELKRLREGVNRDTVSGGGPLGGGDDC